MSSDTTPHVLYISEEFETDIQLLSDFFDSSLWREHFGSDSIDSRNWENHFFDEAERDTFIANMATLCSAMRIISGQTSSIPGASHLRTLSDACVPSGWLMKKLSHESVDLKQHANSWAWFRRHPPPFSPGLPPWVKVENLRERARMTQDVLDMMQTVMQKLEKMYLIFNQGRASGYYEWLTRDRITAHTHTKRPSRAAVSEHHSSATGDPKPQGAGLQVCLNTLQELYLRC